MKDILNKVSGLGAIVLGGYAFLPALVELAQHGMSAFDGCKVAATPFFVSLSAFIAAYLTRSPIAKK